MEPRARRLYLRDQLGRAREALERGESAEALAAVDRALQADPDYLAAQVLKERILRQPASGGAGAPGPSQEAGDAATLDARRATSPATASASASEAGVLRFEQRTRARRIEKRAEAARAALASGRMNEAREAVDEIAALDPQHPEYGLLLTELAARAARRRRLGPAIAAVAVFGASIFAASDIGSPRVSAPPMAATPQPAPPLAGHADASASAGPDVQPVAIPTDLPPPAPTVSETPAVATSGTSLPAPSPQPLLIAPGPVDRPKPELAIPPIAPVEPSDPAQLPGALTTLPQDPRAAPVERPIAAAPAPRPNDLPSVPATPPVGDEDLVLRTLQQYRRAYDTLDARAAEAIWPGVDSAALQRAFDGLVSQRLTFQSCQLQVNGPGASAACRGTARYTPRMGSGVARDEPRNWRFALRKTATGEWQIVSALVAR
ncbi:MAG: hypothetical protein ABL982_07280 [Vicinamibacterales bacterium]